MHTTVLLKMGTPPQLERLRRVARSTPPIRIEVRELFCERVERIKDAEVYCIGVGLASESLRSLKDTWLAEEPVQRRKLHVPYDGEGHISLAYVRGDVRPDVEAFMEQNRSMVLGGSMVLNHITYQDEWGSDHRIPLTGSADGAPRKLPRRGCARPGPPQEIDGSVLEGGGQILRMSSSYAALYGQPIRITKIRAGRSKPGLAAQHLESFRLVRDVCAGALTNDWVGSCDVTLTPQYLSPGRFAADPGTAGAITLMVQGSLVPLLFAGGACSCELKGGTDVSWSPPLDFLRHVLRPSLAQMGASFEVQCPVRGVFPAGGGIVRLETQPLAEALSPIDLGERGDVATARAVLYVTKPVGAEQQAAEQELRAALAALAPSLSAGVSVVAGANNVGKYWVDVVVETSTGALFHGATEPKDLPGYGKGKGKGKDKGGSLSDRVGAAARDAAAAVQAQLATGAAVDCHLVDQLILPASLAAGTSRLLAAELSMHARTALHIAELMVPGLAWREEKCGSLTLLEIDGVAYFPSDQSGTDERAKPVADVTTATASAAADEYDEDIVSLPAGALSAATDELATDFGNDMAALAEAAGVTIAVNAKVNNLVVSGAAKSRKEAHGQLVPVLSFYFGAAP